MRGGRRRAPGSSSMVSATYGRAGRAPGKSSHVAERYRTVQRKASGGRVSDDAAAHLERARGGTGSPLPAPYDVELAEALGVDLSDVRVHTDTASSAAARAIGANAYAEGRSIHFGAGQYDPASTEGQRLLAHEVAHTVQQQGVPAAPQRAPIISAPGDTLEREADTFADSYVAKRGRAHGRVSRGASSGAGAVYRDERPDRDSSAPDLGDASYQWVPGTLNLWVDRSWYEAASDFDASSGTAPSRMAELLAYLRDVGALSWVTPEALERAARAIRVQPMGADVVLVKVGASAFVYLGLPPGRETVVGRQAGGLFVVFAMPAEIADQGGRFPMSLEQKEQALAAMEAFTGLPIEESARQRVLAAEIDVMLGSGAAIFGLRAAECEVLFGADAYAAWREDPQAQADQVPVGGGDAPAPAADLTAEETAWLRQWLEANLHGERGDRHIPLTRLLLQVVQRIEIHGEHERIVALLSDENSEADQLDVAALERAIAEAEFQAARELAGLAPDDRARKTDREPTFDMPLPARIDQHAGLVLDGEKVPFILDIDWPTQLTGAQESDLRWRAMAAEAEWVFERVLPDGQVQRETKRVLTRGGREGVTHAFHLEAGEQEAVWTVHAFVHHSFFLPNHLETRVQVKTEDKRLRELRDESFAALGDFGIADDDHDFDTSFYNETFGDDEYDEGLLFRGELPAEFQRRTPQERRATLDAEIERQEALLAYLRAEGTHEEAVSAAQHYLAKLRDAREAMEGDEKSGWHPFEIRGFFLGRGNRVMDGALDLYGSVTTGELGGAPIVEVQIRDLSRRLAATNYRFRGIGGDFQGAYERAFVDLCKKYPAGRVSALAEEIDPTSMTPTGATLGFELDTGTEWEDTKAVVFDPIVNAAVNIGSAVAMIFVPATIPVLMPALIAYNGTQTVDQMVDEWTSGTLTAGDGVLYLSQIGLDLLPLVGRARVIQSSRLAFAVIEGFELAGQAVVMTLQARDAIAQLRDQDIAQMAELYAQYVEIEAATHPSDPQLTELRAELDKQAETIRGRTAEVWSDLVAQQAISLLPVKAALHLNRHLAGVKLKKLDQAGLIHHAEGVAPHYDRATGRIVGDESHLDLATLDRLSAEQATHMRELATDLADELGVDPSRVAIEPDTELALWSDGADIQVRYEPGTDPADAIATWKQQAAAAGIEADGAPVTREGVTADPTATQVLGVPNSEDGVQDTKSEKRRAKDRKRKAEKRAKKEKKDRDRADKKAKKDKKEQEKADRKAEKRAKKDARARDDAEVPEWANRGEPYADPRVDPNKPRRYLEKRELDPVRRLDVQTSWKAAEAVLETKAAVAIGRPLATADEGHAILAGLAHGDPSGLRALGIDDYPEGLDTTGREWTLVEARDGYVVYAGIYDMVEPSAGVRPIGHTHPGTEPAARKSKPDVPETTDLPVPEGSAGMTYDEILADPASAKKSGIVPSAADINAISDGTPHVLYTRFVHRGDGKIGNPGVGDTDSNVAIHLSNARVLRWNKDTGEYHYSVAVSVRDANGFELWAGEMYAFWYPSRPAVSNTFFERPFVLDRPPPPGWSEP